VARSCLLRVDPGRWRRKFMSQPWPSSPVTVTPAWGWRDGRFARHHEVCRKGRASAALTEDFINFPRSVKGSEVALLFREVSPDKYRVSLRSRGSVDVARIAGDFQGGGHPQAAGCTVEGSLSEVKGKVLGRVKAAL
jgi:nanoRNase/pAp phosphatase (c-di-AMP/oligoRNAs hydrolase)